MRHWLVLDAHWSTVCAHNKGGACQWFVCVSSANMFCVRVPTHWQTTCQKEAVKLAVTKCMHAQKSAQRHSIVRQTHPALVGHVVVDLLACLAGRSIVAGGADAVRREQTRCSRSALAACSLGWESIASASRHVRAPLGTPEAGAISGLVVDKGVLATLSQAAPLNSRSCERVEGAREDSGRKHGRCGHGALVNRQASSHIPNLGSG